MNGLKHIRITPIARHHADFGTLAPFAFQFLDKRYPIHPGHIYIGYDKIRASAYANSARTFR